MMGLPAGTRIWIAAGHTDMRKGFDGLAALVQTALAANAHSGQVFVFLGRRGDIVKVLWSDGQGLSPPDEYSPLGGAAEFLDY